MDEQIYFNKKHYDKIISKISTDHIYTFSTPRQQFYSLPSNIIFQIFNQKKSPHFLLKLLQTCKYFFHKKQILPIIPQSIPTIISDARVFGSYGNTFLDFNFSKKVFFWFDESLSCRSIFPTVTSKIYCCTSLKNLIINHCVFSFNIFEIFFSDSLKIEHFCLNYSNFLYPDGSNIPLNIILKKIPNCEMLQYWNSKETFTRETILELFDIQHSKKFKTISFTLYKLADDFDLKYFCEFIVKNLAPDSSCLIFLVTGKWQLNVIDFMKCFDLLLKHWKENRPKIAVLEEDY